MRLRNAPKGRQGQALGRPAIKAGWEGLVRYKRFLEEIDYLAFIEDKEAAEAAVKAVVGMLAARLDEPTARHLTEKLPGPLSYDKMVAGWQTPPPASRDEAYAQLAEQFGLDVDEAEELVDTVLRTAMEALDRETVREMESRLPEEWRELLATAWEDYETL